MVNNANKTLLILLKMAKFIKETAINTGFYPNYNEIGEYMKMKSKSTVGCYMTMLEEKGYIIRKDRYTYRITNCIIKEK